MTPLVAPVPRAAQPLWVDATVNKQPQPTVPAQTEPKQPVQQPPNADEKVIPPENIRPVAVTQPTDLPPQARNMLLIRQMLAAFDPLDRSIAFSDIVVSGFFEAKVQPDQHGKKASFDQPSAYRLDPTNAGPPKSRVDSGHAASEMVTPTPQKDDSDSSSVPASFKNLDRGTRARITQALSKEEPALLRQFLKITQTAATAEAHRSGKRGGASRPQDPARAVEKAAQRALILLSKHAPAGRMLAESKRRVLYSGSTCRHSRNRHPDLPGYRVRLMPCRSSARGGCAACELLWNVDEDRAAEPNEIVSKAKLLAEAGGVTPEAFTPTRTARGKLSTQLDTGVDDGDDEGYSSGELFWDDKLECCGMDYEEGEPCVMCDTCKRWFHIDCLGIDENDLGDEYHCAKCNRRRGKTPKHQAKASPASRAAPRLPANVRALTVDPSAVEFTPPGMEFAGYGYCRYPGWNKKKPRFLGEGISVDAAKDAFLEDPKASYLGLEKEAYRGEYLAYIYYNGPDDESSVPSGGQTETEAPGDARKGRFRLEGSGGVARKRKAFLTWRKERLGASGAQACCFCGHEYADAGALVSHIIACAKRPTGSPAKIPPRTRNLLRRIVSMGRGLKPAARLRCTRTHSLVLQGLERVCAADPVAMRALADTIRTSVPLFPASCKGCPPDGDKKAKKATPDDTCWVGDKMPALYAKLRSDPMLKGALDRVTEQVFAWGAAPGECSTAILRRSGSAPQHYVCPGGAKGHCSILSHVCSVCGREAKDGQAANLATCAHNRRVLPLATRKGPAGGWKALLPLREAAVLHALNHTTAIVARLKPDKFAYNAGDIIFLYRNAVSRTSGRVHEAAKKCVGAMIDRWDRSVSITSDSQIEFVMGYVECLHAKQRVDRMLPGCESPWRVQSVIGDALAQHALEDVMRFDPRPYLEPGESHVRMTPVQYCFKCEGFQTTFSTCNVCSTPLHATPDFEAMCEAVVWTSVFEDIGVPISTCDGVAKLTHVLPLVKHLRPYRGIGTLGKDLFKLQCYFITHLAFILGAWGKRCVRAQRLMLAEEFTFLCLNVDTVIRMKDPELVGEFVQALHIMGLPDSDPLIERAQRFLLQSDAKMCWAKKKDRFYKRYHSAYCGIIGLARFEFDDEDTVPREWIQAFEQSLDEQQGDQDAEDEGEDEDGE